MCLSVPPPPPRPRNKLISWGLAQSEVTILMFKKNHKIYCYIKSHYELQTSTKVRHGGMAGAGARFCRWVPASRPPERVKVITTESRDSCERYPPASPGTHGPPIPWVSEGPAPERSPVTGPRAASSQGHLHEREE